MGIIRLLLASLQQSTNTSKLGDGIPLVGALCAPTRFGDRSITALELKLIQWESVTKDRLVEGETPAVK